MNWLSHPYFHAWHFAFQQIQLTNWFGNIVAGIVGFLAGGRRLLKDKALHAKVEHVIFHHPDIPDFPTAPNQRITMKVLTSLYYLVRRVWFTLFPRKVGEKGWAPAPSTTALPPVGTMPPAPVTWAAPRLSWGMLGNDRYGDCVFAAICHSIMAVGHFLQRAYTFGYNQVVNAYLAWDHGNDSGVVIDGLLFTWEQDETSNTPLAPFGIGGPFVKLDPTNVEELKSAIATFGWVMVGSNLQKAQETQYSLGQRWSYVPGSPVVGGHAVCLLGYDKAGVGPFIVSWGKGFRATWDWVTKTCPEAYTGVLPPHLAAGKYVEPLVNLDEYCSTLPHV